MKNLAFAVLFISAIAFAGGYAAFTELQSGTGTNGMTYTPASATDGVAYPTGTFGGPFNNNFARLTVSGVAGVFQNATDLSWMRCQHLSANPDAGAFSWNRCPQYDVEIDGGQSGKTIGLNTMQWVIPLTMQVNATSTTERYLWTGENIQQATTLDGGLNVGLELYGLP